MASGLQGFRASGLQGFRRKSNLLTHLSKFALFTFLLALFCVPAWAETEKANVKYYAWDDTQKKLVEMGPVTATVVEGSDGDRGWVGPENREDLSWYVVQGENVEIKGRISIYGTVNLILADGAKLTASKGITVAKGNTLNIYGQSGGTGTLVADASNAGTSYYAGIGGNGDADGRSPNAVSGTVNIHGGTVTATGAIEGAGIGGGRKDAGGTVNIYGGTVNAKGGSIGAGIGGGGAAGGTVAIYGGTVIATGGTWDTYISMGIGGGVAITNHGTLTLGDGVSIQVSEDNTTWSAYDGSTRKQYMKTAQSGPAETSPVVYQAWDAGSQSVKAVEGGCTDYTVVANSTTAFENGKWYVVSSDTGIEDRITVTGTANVILKDGARLFANKGITVEDGSTLNIYAQSTGESMGELTAYGRASNNAGIGGTTGKACGTVNIHGGRITTVGGYASELSGAGIGGGSNAGGGTVTIYGGIVKADGGFYSSGGGYAAAGIGGGLGGSGGTVAIYGGEVTATCGSTEGQGIGHGQGGTGAGTITLGKGIGLEGKDSYSGEYEPISDPGTTRKAYMHTTRVEIPEPTPTPTPGTDGDTLVVGEAASKDVASLNDYLDQYKDQPEQLAKIEKLYFDDAKTLTDLNGVKKLTNVKQVTVIKCPALQSADMSGLAHLEEVNMNNCESLKVLDVSNCPELTSLDCSVSGIDLLKMDGCIKLAFVNCRMNKLGYLDMPKSDFPSLTVLSCDSQTKEGMAPVQSGDRWVTHLAAFTTPQLELETGNVRLASVSSVIPESVKGYKRLNPLEREEIETKYSGGIASFASRPDEMEYYYDTGFNGISMDVTVMGTENGGSTSSNSSGGCGDDPWWALLLVPLPFLF